MAIVLLGLGQLLRNTQLFYKPIPGLVKRRVFQIGVNVGIIEFYRFFSFLF